MGRHADRSPRMHRRRCLAGRGCLRRWRGSPGEEHVCGRAAVVLERPQLRRDTHDVARGVVDDPAAGESLEEVVSARTERALAGALESPALGAVARQDAVADVDGARSVAWDAREPADEEQAVEDSFPRMAGDRDVVHGHGGAHVALWVAPLLADDPRGDPGPAVATDRAVPDVDSKPSTSRPTASPPPLPLIVLSVMAAPPATQAIP